MIERQTGEVTYFYLNAVILGSARDNLTPTVEIRDIASNQFFDFATNTFSSDESSAFKVANMTHIYHGEYYYRFNHNVINKPGTYRVIYRIDDPVYVVEDEYLFDNIKEIHPIKIASYDIYNKKLRLRIYLKDRFGKVYVTNHLKIVITDADNHIIWSIDRDYDLEYVNITIPIELEKSSVYYLNISAFVENTEYKTLEYFYTVG